MERLAGRFGKAAGKRGAWLLALGLVAFAVPVAAEGEAAPEVEQPEPPVYTLEGRPVPELFFALNGIVPFHHLHSDDELVREGLWDDLRERLERIGESGARAVRVDMWWGSIEVDRGRFEWDFPDRVIEEIVAAGLEPLPILCYNAAWSPDRSPATEAERAAFGDWVYRLVRRNRDRVTYWEVWNEPNITPYWVPNPNAEHYSKLLQVVYRRAKEADPDAVIVGMATAGMDLPFIEDVYRAGAAGHMDALSFHFYDSTADESLIEDDYRDVRRLMEHYGEGDLPVLVTESGLSTGPSGIVVASTPAEQASWVVKRHLVMQAEGLEQFYYYKLQDDPPQNGPDGWWGLLRYTGEPKPSWDAYRAMVERIEDAEFLGRVDGLAADPARDPEVEFQLYRQSNGELCAVAWVREDGERLPVSVPAAKPVRVENLDGTARRTVQPGMDGKAVLDLTAEPVYFLDLCEAVAARLAMSIEPSHLYIYPGESRTVEVRFRNPGPEAADLPLKPLLDALAETPVRARLAPPEGEDVALEPSLVAEPGEEVRMPLTLSLPAGQEEFVPVRLFPRLGGKYGTRLTVYYDEPFVSRLAVGERGGGLEAVLTLRNRRAEPADGAVRWLLNGVPRAGETQFEGFGAEEDKVLRRSFQPRRAGETLLEAEIRSEDGVAVRQNYRLLAIPYRRTPIDIDGNLRDWEGIEGARLAPPGQQDEPDRVRQPLNPEELGAKVRLAWDEEYLYVALEVTDPVPLVNPFREGELWRGDSMELFLGFDGPAGGPDYGPLDFQLGLSPGDGGEEPFVYAWRTAQDRPAGLVDGARIASQRTDSGYTMEAAIPFAEFGVEPEGGMAIGLDVNVSFISDPEAERRQGLLIWNGTGRNFLDPSNWGAGVFENDREGAGQPGS